MEPPPKAKQQHATSSQTSGSADADSAQRPIGMVAAYSWEVKPLLRLGEFKMASATGQSSGNAPDSKVHVLRLANTPFLLMVAGAGAENAMRAAQQLASANALRGLVTLGFAGGLAEELKVADVILADRVIDALSGEVFGCDTSIFPVRRAHRGALLSAGSVVSTAAQKRSLREQWQALAVDMESAGVARAALRAGLPFGAIKVITDTAAQSLSIDFDRCQSEDKKLSAWSVVSQATKSFRGIGDLWHLARNSRRAADALAAALALI